MFNRAKNILLTVAATLALCTVLTSCKDSSSTSSVSPSVTSLSLSSSAGDTLANLSSSTITITSNASIHSVGETVTLVASNTSAITFTSGATCTLVAGACTVLVENSNAAAETVAQTLTATSSAGATGSLTLQFTGTASDDAMQFQSVTGVSSTININHTYSATYTFVNDSGVELEDLTATVGSSSAFRNQRLTSGSGSFISNVVNNCNLSQLAAGATCTISADLNTSEDLSTNDFSVSFNYTKNGSALVSAYSQAITAVDNVDTTNKQMAVRVVNSNTTESMYAVVVTNKYNGVGVAQTSSLIPLSAVSTTGTISVYQGGSSASYVACDQGTGTNECPYSGQSIEILPGHEAVLLLPAGTNPAVEPINSTQTGISGVIYLSMATALADGAAPSVTNSSDANFFTRWGQFEYTLATTDSSAPGFTPKYTVDFTAVDFVSLPLVFNALQDAVDEPITNGSVTVNPAVTSGIQSQYSSESMQSILTSIATTLDSSPLASDSWSKLVQRSGGAGSSILRVLSPNIGTGVTAYEMPTDYFTPAPGLYSADLWDYYKTHTLLVDASGATGCTGVTLSGHVSEGSGVYTFAFTSVSTPACDTSITAIATNTAGLPNNYDFFGGAGSSTDAITWGATNTPLAIVGEAIVAAQSVGLMPYPDGEVLSSTNVRTHTFYTDTQTDLLETTSAHTYTHTMFNVYSQAVSEFFNCYTYPYGDFLGADGTVSESNVQLAPITLTLTG